MLALLVVWLALRSLVQSRSLSSILPMLFGVALGFGLSAPAWLALLDYVHGSARELQPSSAHWQWIVPPSAWPGLILPCWTVNWADFSTRMTPHSATELACGLVPIPALVAGFIGRGRALLRQLKWELLLLLFIFLLCMLPTAGVFRWSFRWLPFFHLILALCAAEALRGFAQGRPVLLRTPRMRCLHARRFDCNHDVDLTCRRSDMRFRSPGFFSASPHCGRQLKLSRATNGWWLGASFCRVRRIPRDLSLHSAELRRAEIQPLSRTSESGAVGSATALLELLSSSRN